MKTKKDDYKVSINMICGNKEEFESQFDDKLMKLKKPLWIELGSVCVVLIRSAVILFIFALYLGIHIDLITDEQILVLIEFIIFLVDVLFKLIFLLLPFVTSFAILHFVIYMIIRKTKNNGGNK